MNYIGVYANMLKEKSEFIIHDCQTEDFQKACNSFFRKDMIFLYWKQTPFYTRPETDDAAFIDFYDERPPEGKPIWLLFAGKHINMVVYLSSQELLGQWGASTRQKGFYECIIDQYGRIELRLNRSRAWATEGGKWQLVLKTEPVHV